jgi:cytoskeleton protein RodZ
MNTLGEKLRAQRISKGIELSQIASETRISSRYLQALESGDSKILPGAVFAKSFARQYARCVDLDESVIEADLQLAFPLEENLPTLEDLNQHRFGGPIHVEPLPDVVGASISLRPQMYKSAIALLLVVAACSGVYMGWQAWLTRQAAEPTSLVELRPPPLATPSEPTSASPVSATAPAPEPASDTGSAAGELNAPGNDGSGMAVQVVASERTWVSITVNGHSVFRGTLSANEARIIPGVQRAQMVIGNAGGVDVRTDGKSIGEIGPRGQVRVVLLTPEGTQILRSRKELESKRESVEGTS